MKKFRFAILGAGHIARQFCDAVSRIDGCEVCAVASKKSCASRKTLRRRMVLKAIMMITRHYWRRKDQIVPILQ